MQALGRHVRLVQLWSHAAERAHAHQVHSGRVAHAASCQLMKHCEAHRADRTTRQPSDQSGHGWCATQTQYRATLVALRC